MFQTEFICDFHFLLRVYDIICFSIGWFQINTAYMYKLLCFLIQVQFSWNFGKLYVLLQSSILAQLVFQWVFPF